jgi:hypothetical protein
VPIAVTFRAGGPGTRRAEVVISHDAPRSPRQVMLIGESRQEGPGQADGCTDLVAGPIAFAIERRIKQVRGPSSASWSPSGTLVPLRSRQAQGRREPLRNNQFVRSVPLAAPVAGRRQADVVSTSLEQLFPVEEFPPQYRADVNAATDCNRGNNTAVGSGADINRMLSGPSKIRGQ